MRKDGVIKHALRPHRKKFVEKIPQNSRKQINVNVWNVSNREKRFFIQICVDVNKVQRRRGENSPKKIRTLRYFLTSKIGGKQDLWENSC